jgi:hypothetical protein
MLDLARVLLSWPPVTLVAFVLFLWKGEKVIQLMRSIAEVRVSKEGVVIRGFPHAQLLEYSSKDAVTIEPFETPRVEEIPPASSESET